MNPKFRLPNAQKGKPYEVYLKHFGIPDGIEINFPSGIGLIYRPEHHVISGIPSFSGEFLLCFKSLVDPAEEDRDSIELHVLPDPKELWNVLEPPADSPFFVSSTAFECQESDLGKAVAASVRGRAHAHEGRFREDAFSLFLSQDGVFGVFAVADGAGSAPLSRLGAQVVCSEVKLYASTFEHQQLPSDFLGRIFIHALGALREVLGKEKIAPKDVACTLSVAVAERTGKSVKISAAGVGDCPVIFVPKDRTPLVLHEPEEGEYSGETRFLKDFMQDEPLGFEFAKRLVAVETVGSGSVFLLSDGVSDPWFESRNALGNNENWHKMMDSLPQSDKEEAWLEWLGFWSPGNHDDRTLIRFQL